MKNYDDSIQSPEELASMIDKDDLTQFETKLRAFIKEHSPKNFKESNDFCNELTRRLYEKQSNELNTFFVYLNKQQTKDVESIRMRILLMQKTTDYFTKRGKLISEIMTEYINNMMKSV